MPTTTHKQTSKGKQAQLAPEDEGGKVETSSRLTNAHQTQHQQQAVTKGTTKSKSDDENDSNIDEVYIVTLERIRLNCSCAIVRQRP